MAISKPQKPPLYRVLAAVGALLLVATIPSWLIAARLIAANPRQIGEPPADLPATAIALASKSGSSIAGWHIQAAETRGVIVLLHPIRGSRLTMLRRARTLHAAGYAIVMIDLQAHGESSGAKITLGHLEKHDARAAVAYARAQHPGEPIAVLGVSLGGAAALLASPLEVDALVLESVFPSIEQAVHNRVASRLGWASALPAEILLLLLQPHLGLTPPQLRPIAAMDGIGCPVFVLSGSADTHTTPAEAKQMFDAAQTPAEFWLVEGAAHEDLFDAAPAEYRKRVLAFFERHMAAQ